MSQPVSFPREQRSSLAGSRVPSANARMNMCVMQFHHNFRSDMNKHACISLFLIAAEVEHSLLIFDSLVNFVDNFIATL